MVTFTKITKYQNCTVLCLGEKESIRESGVFRASIYEGFNVALS